MKRKLPLTTINKYVELSGTIYDVEADKAKLASLSIQSITDEKAASPLPVKEGIAQTGGVLLRRSDYVGLSVPTAAYRLLREAKRSMHAKDLFQRLLEGRMQIKGGTPLTPVATHSRETNVSGKWGLIPLKLWRKH